MRMKYKICIIIILLLSIAFLFSIAVGIKFSEHFGPEAKIYKDFLPLEKKAMVVARYNEDLSWLKQVPSTIKIFVYNKGKDDIFDLPANAELFKLPNLGREANTYLYHVTTHYDSLKDFDRIIFVQGDPFDHGGTDINYFINGEPEKNANIIGKCTYVSISEQSKGLDSVQWDETKWKYVEPSTQSLLDFFKDPINYNYSSDNDVICVVFGANFAVYTSSILCHDLSYHERVFSRFQKPNPKEGHYMERCWNEWAHCNNQNISYKHFVLTIINKLIKNFLKLINYVNEKYTRICRWISIKIINYQGI